MHENTKRGVIFDLDGTLLNTIEDIGDSVNEVLERSGEAPYSYDEYKQMVGLGFRALLKAAFPAETAAERLDQAMVQFEAAYHRRYSEKTAPYAGVKEMLIELQHKGILMGVNTNKRQSYTEALLAKHFPSIRWTKVMGEQTGLPKKPDPAAALNIISAMRLPKERIVYVGDSKTDMQTGTNAGLETIGVLWGFRDKQELEDNGASHIVSRPGELITLL